MTEQTTLNFVYRYLRIMGSEIHVTVMIQILRSRDGDLSDSATRILFDTTCAGAMHGSKVVVHLDKKGYCHG